jgi:Zn finger protein HypA/HybF involved in hydrogenase expression
MNKQKIRLQCLDCEMRFRRVLSSEHVKEIECPKCKSKNIDLAEVKNEENR